jgi:oligopeptide transport system permease protein
MLRFIARRFLEMIPVLFIVVTATFFMMKLAPGGPLDREKATTPEIRRRLEEHYGLNKPVWQQYLDHLAHLARGDLGPSFKYAGWTVNELIADAFPVSLELGCYALAFALTAGLLAGIVASLRPNTPGDYLPMALATVGLCLPTVITGPLLVLLFGLVLGWYNTSGWFFPGDRVLPALTLVLKHSLRGGLLSVVSFLGPAITGLVTGSLVVETIFQIPGLGRFFVMAGFNRDYTMVLGTVLFYAFLILVMNLIVDILQVWLNPKLRFE